MPPKYGDTEAAPSGHAYLRFLQRLHAGWHDAPQVSVSYRDLSVVFKKPRSDAPPAATSADAPPIKRAVASSEVPNLLTTIKQWITTPIVLAAEQVGVEVQAPLRALSGATGIIPPGSMTLVLAPPGHGKSSLLKALAGRLPESSIRGELLYNGKTRGQLAAEGIRVNRLASYVGQLDLHFATLTALETVQFAADSSVPDAALLGDSPDPMLVELEAQRAAMLVELLGLHECANTIVGNEMLRGISGGQRKRVTLGEMMVSNARLFCLDEVSTGLDAAVTASIFGSLREMCGITGCSVVTALLQPTPETYALFDQVIMLHEGQVVYHGPRADMKRWLWQVCGLDVPVDVDEASFLMDFLVNPKMAYESAQVVAQAHSFLEVTRQAREADEAEAKEASTTGSGAIIKSPFGRGPADAPELYDQYHTYSQVRPEANDPEVSHVRFHFAEDEDEVAEATVIKDEGESASPENGAVYELSPSPDEADGLLAPPKKKALGGAPLHSSAGVSPIKDMADLASRHRLSRWHGELHSALESAAKSTKPMNAANWCNYTRANFSQDTPHSYGRHVRLCFSRQWKLFSRNVPVIMPRLAKALSIGLCFGLLFWNLRYDQFVEKLAICCYGGVFAAMTNLSELPVASEARNVVAKQLDAGYFKASPYTFAVCAMHIPITIFESTCYALMFYMISGLERDAGRFLFHFLVCLISSNAMATFYRFISYITPNPDVARQLDLPFVVLFILLNAWVVAYNNLMPFLRYWLYYISPLSWTTVSLAINEYSADKYKILANDYLLSSSYSPDLTMGEYYLSQFDMPSTFVWKWMGVVYLVGWQLVWMTICIFTLNRIGLVALQGSERENYEEEKKKPVAAQQQQQLALSAPTPARHVALDIESDDAGVEMVGVPRHATPDVMDAIDGLSKPTGGVASVKLTALPFTPVTLAWSNLNYSVTLANGTERVLLHDVSGFGVPGEMCALMGASGAGKTTLMDCIAGRKTTGKLSADVLLNGQKVDVNSSFFQQLTGYVEQTDLHIGTSTVEEALRFSARLRLPTSVPVETQHRFVQEVMELLGLEAFAHLLIGDAAIPGLAPAQLKLVTIGVELVANPSILFLDEPTSGLDAPAAWRVMTAIQRIALTGRNVLCTIHQPAARLFFLFNRLLLLQPGGRTIYFHEIGPRGETLVPYFEAASGFKSTMPPGVNPANWMLEISAPAAEVKLDWPQLWDESRLHQQVVLPMIARAIDPKSYTGEEAALGAGTAGTDGYASWMVRLWEVQKRLAVSHWRNGPMNLTRAIISITIGILIGVVFYRIDPTDFSSVNSFLAGIFMSLGFGPSLPCVAALPTFFRQRAVYYRESTVRMYDYRVYIISLTVVEFFSLALLMFIYLIPLYFMMGLVSTGTMFWRMYFQIFLISQIYAFLAQAYLAYLPNQMSASVVHAIIYSFLFVFGGLLISAKAYPVGFKWFYYMISTPKAYVAIALNQLSCSDAPELSGGRGCGVITIPGMEPQTVYKYVSDMLENSSDSYGNQVGWLLLMLAVLKCTSTLGFKYVSHLKR